MWVRSIAAAVVALIALSPVVCLSEIGETARGAIEVTSCHGLLPLRSTWGVAGLAAVGAFAVTFLLLRRRSSRGG